MKSTNTQIFTGDNYDQLNDLLRSLQELRTVVNVVPCPPVLLSTNGVQKYQVAIIVTYEIS